MLFFNRRCIYRTCMFLVSLNRVLVILSVFSLVWDSVDFKEIWEVGGWIWLRCIVRPNDSWVPCPKKSINTTQLAIYPLLLLLLLVVVIVFKGMFIYFKTSSVVSDLYSALVPYTCNIWFLDIAKLNIQVCHLYSSCCYYLLF